MESIQKYEEEGLDDKYYDCDRLITVSNWANSLSWVFLVFGGLSIPAYTSMKPPLYQRIGDRDAKTIVVGAKEEIIQQPREWWWFLLATALYLLINATVVFIQAIAAIS